MNLPAYLARQIEAVHFGGNWTDVNLQDTLQDISWKQAIAKIDQLNSIASLVYHINYYNRAIINVLEQGELTAKDTYSFDVPPINSQLDWENLLNNSWEDVKRLVKLVEHFPTSRLEEDFTAKIYGSYYYNFQGIIEHAHYHLGQIVLIKKMLLNKT